MSFAAHERRDLLVPDGLQGHALPAARVDVREDAAHLLQEAAREHRLHPQGHAAVEFLARAREGRHRVREARRRAREVRRDAARAAQHLHRAHHPARVALQPRELARGGALHLCEERVQTVSCEVRLHEGLHLPVRARHRRQSTRERRQVEPRPAHHERRPPAREDVRDRGLRVPHEARHVVRLPGIHDVHHVMRHARPLARRGLGRPDVHAAVHQEGVRRDDLQREARAELQRERRLARRRRGRQDGNERAV